MLNITKNANGSDLKVILEGRLDTTTAPQLEAALNESLSGVTAHKLEAALVEDLSGFTDLTFYFAKHE